jgi:hypothetical protein
MDPVMLADMVAEKARVALGEALAPQLMALPRVPVSAEVWKGERHVRLHGEALYAIHTADRAAWAIVVEESSHLEPGSIEIVDVDEVRCETATGRRGR